MADQFAATPRSPNDLFNRSSGLCLGENGGVGLLPAKISLILEPFGGGQ
jgi:hypothetical protein